jgi:hypothetical protein
MYVEVAKVGAEVLGALADEALFAEQKPWLERSEATGKNVTQIFHGDYRPKPRHHPVEKWSLSSQVN